MLNKNTLCVKKCAANQKQHCKQVAIGAISAEAKKSPIKDVLRYLNDINSL